MLLANPRSSLKSRSRGRPKSPREDGLTPELKRKQQEFHQQWQVHHPKTFARSWWDIFLDRGDISPADFRLSQDFGYFQVLGKQLNQDHKIWRCALSKFSFTTIRSLNEAQKTQISQWWHTWLPFAAYYPEAKFLDELYSTQIPWLYDAKLYSAMCLKKNQALLFLKERWMFRHLFREILEG
jgi:hypothetical protein